MSKLQNVAFQSMNEFLHFLPDEELKIVEALRSLVQECIPDVKEKLAYNVPYYYRHSRICFIWPSAVQWGKTVKSGVEFGFCKGHLLPDPSYLHSGNRKEVYIKTFHSLKEINTEIVRQLLYEAVMIDEEAYSSKKK
jgi:hypothetical protein